MSRAAKKTAPTVPAPANPCDNCQWRTSTGDHFDKPIEDARRRECQLVPDWRKPCLSNTETPAISGPVAAATCAAQCRALVLRNLDASRKEAERADVAGRWDDADADVLLALDAARGIIAGLAPGGDLLTFDAAWYRALAVVALAKRCYSPGLATCFGRILAGIEDQLRVLPELWEVVARDLIGDYVLVQT